MNKQNKKEKLTATDSRMMVNREKRDGGGAGRE